MALHRKTSRRLVLEGQEYRELVLVELEQTMYPQLKIFIYLFVHSNQTKQKSQGLSKFPVSRICSDLY